MSSSRPITDCQICENKTLESFLFLGYMPPVNQLLPVGTTLTEQPSYPAELLYCNNCDLVQLGLVVDKEVLFPAEYPYTSSTTKVLRENFAELYREATQLIQLGKDDLVVDIGSNDGNLLSNFRANHRVLGVTPEDIGRIAIERGIPTLLSYFDEKTAELIRREHGKAKIITATNVFAHIDDVNTIVELIKEGLAEDGVFISESHYLLPLVKTNQYDTVYHEHLRYYSLHSLEHLLTQHDLEVFHAKDIPSHGGSIRVYAARKGHYPVQPSVSAMRAEEEGRVTNITQLREFAKEVTRSKMKLYGLLSKIKEEGKSISAVGAPSRGSTLVSYVGLDEGIIDGVAEAKGSHKVGKYLPGTLIPILAEETVLSENPDYLLFLSWHIADELIPKIRAKGYQGQFIIPLPEPRIVE